MNVLAAKTLVHIAKAITSSELVDHILKSVKEAMVPGLSGSERRVMVLASLKDTKGDLIDVAKDTANYLINMLIEIAVHYVTVKMASRK